MSTQQPRVFLSPEESDIILTINYVFICTILCFFGIGTNIINTVVFCKQGFANTMNISLVSLSISDLFGLIVQLWSNVCFNPFLRHADIPFVPEEVQYLTGTGPAVCFGRINSWITVFITSERCLSIAMPLKVKQIINPKITTLIMVIIYIMNVLGISTEYFKCYLNWTFYPEKNRTLYGLDITTPVDAAGILTYLLNLLIGFGSFIGVIVFTLILVVSLARKSAWRQRAISNTENSKSKVNRDRRTIKMVVVIASVMIACCTPFTVVVMAFIFESEVSIQGKDRNTFFVLLSVGFVFQNLNSSVNIILYYRMSTKYRQKFQELFTKFVSK